MSTAKRPPYGGRFLWGGVRTAAPFPRRRRNNAALQDALTAGGTELYGKYRTEMQKTRAAAPMTEAQFCDYLTGQTRDMRSVRIQNEGILYYRLQKRGGANLCSIPVFGYYAGDEKTLSRLFEKLAEEQLNAGDTVFSVRLYAHDDSSIRLFSMLQFGMVSERGVRRIGGAVAEDADIHELSKDELARRWAEVWSLTSAIVAHLQKSPVFYPGTEFTEDVYRDFYMDEHTKVYGAFGAGGELIGVIESNGERDALAFGSRKSVNIGEIYVLPEYRGTRLSDRLLHFAESRSGADFAWVEHGTANPNARGFWNRFFTAYQYEMQREIHAVANAAL